MEPTTRTNPLPGWLAIVLVAGTSASVLVLEILAARLLAPYVGVSIETYTAVIGTVLAGIAAGAGVGGWAADRVDPRRLMPALLGIGGALAIASIPIVRALGGDGASQPSASRSVVLAAFGFMPAAAVLSAVPPCVVKLQLRTLASTGSTVGRLSAWSTGGAIAGTFLAGFVLVAYAAVTTLIVAVGLLLVAAGVVLWVLDRQRRNDVAVATTSVLLLALVGVAAVDTPCDVQTGYYCVSIEVDPDRSSGRVLVLDDLRHSYVDLADPTHLEFWYVRRIVDAIEVDAPAGPLDIVSVGGGGLTIPRWARASRPGSQQVVLEIDPQLVDVVERDLAFVPGPDVGILTGDGRLRLRAVPTASADVVVGDAFGSRSVPWHLATEEFVTDVARVLRPGGIYAVNVIDSADESFLRAQVATIARVLPQVAVVRGPNLLRGSVGNAVVIASDEPIDVAAWDARRRSAGDEGALVVDIAAYIAGAIVLTDDYAPVDQLITGWR